MHIIDDLTAAFSKLPGIGPRQARRFVYHLLDCPAGERDALARLIQNISGSISQCSSCMRFADNAKPLCSYCKDISRDPAVLAVIEKDQDLIAFEKTHEFKGHYFVLGGTLTLSGKNRVREKDFDRVIKDKISKGLSEVILALAATTEGEMTTDYLKDRLLPYRDTLTISVLGRGLATGSELEYADKETLSNAYRNRKIT
jgi:recombination protein RecR